jgi:DNA polymerase
MLMMSYRVGNGPVHLWVPRDSMPQAVLDDVQRRQPAAILQAQRAVPTALKQHIESGGAWHAHNAQFERVVMNGTAGKKLGFPRLDVKNAVCTAAKAAAHGLPRALGDACKAVGAHAKDDLGKIDMLMLSRPRKHKTETRWTPENAPDKWANVMAYCIDDTYAESDLDTKVPDLTPEEMAVYQLDAEINDRGVLVDLPAVENARFLVQEYKRQLEVQCERMTANELFDIPGVKPTQREKVAEWIRANGWPNLTDLQAETVNQLTARDDVPENVKRMLRLYSTYGMKAVSKFDTLVEMACQDSKLHGTLLYHGANTGRWSSMGVQLQNMSRGHLAEDEDAGVAIDAMAQQDLDLVRLLYPGVDPMKVLASCVRGCLIPAPGHDFIANDFAGIESRVNAWLFDEQWKLDAFTAYDNKTGPDLYKVAYARAFQILVDSVTKKQRQLGKVMELALGYEGGVGAFVTMVATYGINLDEMTAQVLPILPEEVVESAEWLWKKQGQKTGVAHDVFIACDGLKQLWRLAHPRIVQGWKDLREAAEQAVQHPGTAFKIPNGKIIFKVIKYGEHRWLCMRLPSGRKLYYFSPRWDADENQLRYMGIDTYTRQYTETSTYGGKLCENAVQAISRDLLVHAMFGCETAGYKTILTIHDEIVAEVPKTFGSVEEMRQIMRRLPAWAKGLPVDAAGARLTRYAK